MDKYKFERREGLPKGEEAKRYRYFGFDADGLGFILRWNDLGEAWWAIGFDVAGAPIVIPLKDEHADFIQSHALAPINGSVS